MPRNQTQLITQVIALVEATGEGLLKSFGKLTASDINIKELGGLVTRADREAEEQLMDGLHKLVPGCAILAEESGEQSGTAGRFIIDPLDGTSNFAAGLPWYAISVGYEQTVGQGDVSLGVIYHPAQREMFHAVQGQGAFRNRKEKLQVSDKTTLQNAMLATGFYYHKGRELHEAMAIFERLQEVCLGVRRFGAAALDLAYLAWGRYDGFWEKGLSPWDCAAGKLLIEESGGKLTDFRGQPYNLYSNEFVGSNGKLHSPIIDQIRG